MILDDTRNHTRWCLHQRRPYTVSPFPWYQYYWCGRGRTRRPVEICRIDEEDEDEIWLGFLLGRRGVVEMPHISNYKSYLAEIP